MTTQSKPAHLTAKTKAELVKAALAPKEVNGAVIIPLPKDFWGIGEDETVSFLQNLDAGVISWMLMCANGAHDLYLGLEEIEFMISKGDMVPDDDFDAAETIYKIKLLKQMIYPTPDILQNEATRVKGFRINHEQYLSLIPKTA